MIRYHINKVAEIMSAVTTDSPKSIAGTKTEATATCYCGKVRCMSFLNPACARLTFISASLLHMIL